MENNSSDENSNDGLQIIIDSPKHKKRSKTELDESDKRIIEGVERDLEENLEQKAAKANLTAKHVKNIIKEVVTNEHVLALVRHVENPDNNDGPIAVYEPKYTRAKTKQLLSTSTQPKILSWASSAKAVSEVQRLFTEDLQEDSSGDEYVPKNHDKNCWSESQLDSTQKTTKDVEEANIALRTRSKLSLSHTPLEVIEEAFMPPDITTDMYDMNCDDDVWKEFLKTFTRPLDEVTKAAEDEDHDPEYNVLADEEIDEVDKEELRADKAVTVSRKELNCLMAELFEFADIYESNKQNEKDAVLKSDKDSKLEETEHETTAECDSENDPDISIKKCQIPILAQQIRQHVQILTQNFLLSYEHPEFHDMAPKFRDMLDNINEEGKDKSASIYHAINLKPALALIEYWERLFLSNDKDALDCKQYVIKVISESINAKTAGTEYIVTFPPFLMKTMSSSEVFIYPNLLPRIPFKSLNVSRCSYHFFTHGEESLIALFLEQATPHMKQDPFHLTKCKTVNMEHMAHLIHTLLMPHVGQVKIARFIRNKKHATSDENPIKFFYRNKKAPPTVHYVIPMDNENVLPPCRRSPDSLPLLWREYNYPNYKNEKVLETNNNPIIIISSPLQLRPATDVNFPSQYNVNLSKKIVASRKIQPNGPLLPPVNNYIRRKRRNVGKESADSRRNKSGRENGVRSQSRRELKEDIAVIISELKEGVHQTHDKMLPDMPSLGTTPLKSQNPQDGMTSEKQKAQNENMSENQNLTFKNISQFEIQFQKPDNISQVRRNFESINEFSCSQKDISEKDNPDDINELMIASSTVKNISKKEPSGAEKKRAKMRREFVANLVMATPDDPESENQKDENAFFEKLRQTLTVDDYDKIMDILGHYDESSGEFLELYKNVQSVLYPTYKELSEEFLLFLSDIQAHQVKQLMPYFIMKDMDRFMRKLHIYFKDQPSQMKKIVKCLTDLSENSNVTLENIKTTVLPLFKGNAALTNWFLQLLPSERPPDLLISGPHEVIDMSKELARSPEETIYETVLLPDTEDPYGGPTCICPCHNDENPHFQSRSQHCKKCGLKFIQGKIYIQTGKALRPAVVSFLTNPEKDHSKRLTATQRKRSETSPSKQATSPAKEGHEELRHSNESDDDGESKKKNQRQAKTTRKRKIKSDKFNTPTKDSNKPNKENFSRISDKTNFVKSIRSSQKKQIKRRSSTKRRLERKPGSNPGQQKRSAEEQEIESEPVEYIELKVSSDHSGESESEFFESSQDVTNTDSEDSSCSPNLSPLQQNESTKQLSWSREEDKIILQAFQQRSGNEETFQHISEVLQNRSVTDIKSRFHKLMNLLQQMNAGSS